MTNQPNTSFVPFGKKAAPAKVQDMCGGNADAIGWNTVREWTGGKAEATPALQRIARELAA